MRAAVRRRGSGASLRTAGYQTWERVQSVLGRVRSEPEAHHAQEILRECVRSARQAYAGVPPARGGAQILARKWKLPCTGVGSEDASTSSPSTSSCGTERVNVAARNRAGAHHVIVKVTKVVAVRVRDRQLGAHHDDEPDGTRDSYGHRSLCQSGLPSAYRPDVTKKPIFSLNVRLAHS